jgi:uncharacterized tellurite resistance protein B-like protein
MSQNSPQRWFNLEEHFFHDVDQHLLDKLREQASVEQSAEAIMRVMGITDRALAEEIAKINITVETLAAFRLAPLVAVAWADDRIEENERYVITTAAEKSGMKPEDAAMKLLESWTVRRPSAELLEAWCDYTKSLCGSLSEEHRRVLKQEVMEQVNAVAHASGGFLGFGSVSPSEKDVIARIESSLA